MNYDVISYITFYEKVTKCMKWIYLLIAIVAQFLIKFNHEYTKSHSF